MIDKLRQWTDGVVQSLKNKYNRLGLKASGRWEKGLTGDVQELGNGKYKIIIEGEHYTWHLVHGRRPTAPNKRGRLYGIILQWVKDKKLNVDNPKRFAYFVAKKIDEKGIKVPNSFNDGTLLDDVEGYVDELKKELSDKYSMQITSDVIKSFMDGHKN